MSQLSFPRYQREKRRFLRLYCLACLVLSLDVWFLVRAERHYRELYEKAMREQPASYGIGLEYRTVSFSDV